MYVGDNDNSQLPVDASRPANADGQYAGRPDLAQHRHLREHDARRSATNIVGWEWDTIPTQAQYLATSRPASSGSARPTSTRRRPSPVDQDEGRQRTTFPPAGLPGTVSAVKYTAPSGAQVFAAGTMQWSLGARVRGRDPRIQQATYNILSDMGVQPQTRRTGSRRPRRLQHVADRLLHRSPRTRSATSTVTFNASASNDPDGTIAKYEWDLDGNGTYETSRRRADRDPQTTPPSGEVDVRLRVTDNRGATDVPSATVNVIGNQFPTASFTASPNPVNPGPDRSPSTPPPPATPTAQSPNTNGTSTATARYETNTGTTPTTSTTYATPGTVQVGLRVTDNGGKQATKTLRDGRASAASAATATRSSTPPG